MLDHLDHFDAKKVVFEKVFTRGISENSKRNNTFLRKCILYIVSCHGYSKVPTSSLVFIKPIIMSKKKIPTINPYGIMGRKTHVSISCTFMYSLP